MSKINNILSELGVSKVRLAKYLGVSRQMLYNYLACENLDEWPSEKATRLMQLLEVKSSKESPLISKILYPTIAMPGSIPKILIFTSLLLYKKTGKKSPVF